MEYIFEHERLRVDEIMRKVNAKNNFTPLKPLRNANFNFRRKTIAMHLKGNNHSNSLTSKQSYANENVKFRSNSSAIQKVFDLALFKEKPSDFHKHKIREALNQSFQHSERSKIIDNEQTLRIFPLINKSSAVIIKCKRAQNEHFSKETQSLITYVPTVAYLSEKEDQIKKLDIQSKRFFNRKSWN